MYLNIYIKYIQKHSKHVHTKSKNSADHRIDYLLLNMRSLIRFLVHYTCSQWGQLLLFIFRLYSLLSILFIIFIKYQIFELFKIRCIHLSFY